MKSTWQYDEFRQVGKDYSKKEEAEIYDDTHADFRNIEQESLAILDAIGIAGDDVIIEFGSGTGILAVLASERCRTVYAVDISEAMLQEAKRKAEKAGRDNITFVNAGFLTYDHRDAPADKIITSLALHHLPDFWKSVALKRMNAMLRPGGRLLIADVVIPANDPVENIDAFIEKQAASGGDFLREDAEAHFKEEFSTYEWIIEGLLERSGFEIINKDIKEKVFCRYLCQKKG